MSKNAGKKNRRKAKEVVPELIKVEEEIKNSKPPQVNRFEGLRIDDSSDSEDS